MKICNRLVPALYQLYLGDATSIHQQRKHTQERVQFLLRTGSYTKVSTCLVLRFFGSDMNFRTVKDGILHTQLCFVSALSISITQSVAQGMP